MTHPNLIKSSRRSEYLNEISLEVPCQCLKYENILWYKVGASKNVGLIKLCLITSETQTGREPEINKTCVGYCLADCVSLQFSEALTKKPQLTEVHPSPRYICTEL